MAKIELNNTERLILANQYKILSLLEEEDSYARLSEQLLEGHEWLYSQSLDDTSEVMPNEDAEHVLTILGIFGDLRDSYAELADKTGIEPHQVVFSGFDGNNESDLRSFARALRRSDRFVETLGDEIKNSHMPTTDIYKRMIAKWRELGEPNYPYSKDVMLAIIGARVHPDNR
mgnify:CR=1 FL=1